MTSASAARLAPPPRRWWPDVIGAFAVLAIALKTTFHIGRVRDLWLADETAYLASGVRLLIPGFPNDDHGLPLASASPFYAGWYAVLHLAIRDLTDLYYANWSLQLTLIGLGLYALQRKLDVAPGVALVSTFLLATSGFFDVWPYPCEFALLVVIAGLLLTLSIHSPTSRGGVLIVTLVACIFIRPEMSLTLGIVIAATSYLGVRGWRQRRWTLGVLGRDAAIVAGIAALPLAVFGNPLAGGRSFFAWSQHYALGQSIRHRTQLNPWLNTDAIVSRDFGHVTSVSEALRANPRAFASNVALNASLLPSRFSELLRPILASIEVGQVTAALLALLTAVAAVGVVSRWRSPAGGDGDCSFRLLLGVWVAAVVTATADVLVIHPRLHYLQVPVGLGLVLVTAGLRPVGAWARHRFGRPDADSPSGPAGVPWRLLALGGILLILTPNRAYGACPQIALGMASPPAWPFPQTRATVNALRDLGLARHVVVLEQGYSYAFYAGLDFDRAAEWTKDRPFDTFMRERDVGLVVLSTELDENGLYSNDEEYRAFRSDPARAGFRVIPVPGTTTQIAVRNDFVIR